MKPKLSHKYIIITESDWDDIFRLGKEYRIRYDDENTPYVLDEHNEERFDIFHFEDDFKFKN